MKTRAMLLFTLTVACFDDSITTGLECDNDLECGDGQACGPDPLEDEDGTRPGKVCGIPADEGWEACDDADAVECDASDVDQASACRDGYRTALDCDSLCAEQGTGDRPKGVCGGLIPNSDLDCACAYDVNETPDSAADCVQSAAGLELVRSETFESAAAAVYLQTCDEWCELQTGLPVYEGSVCLSTFEDVLRNGPLAIGNALANQLGDQPCICTLDQEPTCDQDITACVGSNGAVEALAICSEAAPTLIQCPQGCDEIELEGVRLDWCL